MNQGMIKKNITEKSIDQNPEYYDVIIIGTGIAGMFTALSVEKKLKILMITKETLDRSTSHMAQGGIASPIFGKRLYSDTVRAGGYENNRERVKILVEEGAEQIEKLIRWGVDFDRDPEGNLLATREGGHSGRNILHCKDETGKKIMKVLEKKLCSKEGITLMEDTYAYQLTPSSKERKSPESPGPEAQETMVSVILPEGRVGRFRSPNVVIATGGIGGLYQHTSNPEGNTGDGMVLAKMLGIDLKNMEFNQFHPTYFKSEDKKGFLITEALRGEGAVLRNEKGVAFMKERHPMGDLAPRDVVARGIFEELQKTKDSMVSVDISHRKESFIKQRFPKVYGKALKRGYDITQEPLPVTPASHYIMGGIAVNEYGETSVPGIFAVGECACTEVHGANRLASNSLLEAIVFAARAATVISKYPGGRIKKELDRSNHSLYKSIGGNREEDEFAWTYEELKSFREALKRETQKVLGIIKKDRLLQEFQSDQELALRLFQHKNPPGNWTVLEKRDFYEVRNRLILAQIMTKAALGRRNNIGAHFKVEKEKAPV